MIEEMVRRSDFHEAFHLLLKLHLRLLHFNEGIGLARQSVAGVDSLQWSDWLQQQSW